LGRYDSSCNCCRQKTGEIYAKLDDVTAAFEKRSFITVVWGAKALFKLAASDKATSKNLSPGRSTKEMHPSGVAHAR
jgi:hypothetical protein